MNSLDEKNSSQTLLQWLSFLLFIGISTVLFIYLNGVQPHYFIDEMFHIPQVLRYCKGNFYEWDPKITTLPGVYLITTIFLAPLNLCNIQSIRFTNLIATFLNFYLIVKLMSCLKCIQSTSQHPWINLLSCYNIVLFPPLFFWFFLYYTDVCSVSVILTMYLLHLQGRIKLAAVAGVIAVLVRQTNIIWVLFFTIMQGLELLELKAQKPLLSHLRNSPNHLQWFLDAISIEYGKGSLSFLKFSMDIVAELTPYITVVVLFLIFIVWNGGIVVGDRTAHVPTIHIPQIFYFFSFTLCFAWPYMILYWKQFLRDLQKHWSIFSFIFCLLTVVIHSNTLVHPYILADNRHYTFYVWNYMMGRYALFKYLLIPLYIFSAYSFFKCLSHVTFLIRIAFLVCTCIVLVPQLLLEPRYFIIPYILFRLNIQNPKLWQICLETVTTLTINCAQFFIFVNKTFYWQDQEHPQRISW